MVKKINLVMFILLIIFTMTGCTSSIKNTQEEKQKIKYSEEDVTDTINNYYGEYYPNGPNGSMDDVLDDGTVVGKTFDYYYDSDFEELACIVYIDLYTGDIVEKASDGTIVDEYTNYDRSKEVQIYKKVGVRAIFSNAICVYQNTSLKRVAYTPTSI